MVLLLRAIDRIQAYLLRDLLSMHGIKAHVFNEHMSSIAGDVPCDAALPQLWLDDEGYLARAKAVLQAHESEAAHKRKTLCPHCGEENPSNFEMCWSCGTALFP